MATNPIPTALAALFALAEDIADGCHTHEADIGLKQNKEADMRSSIAAARTAESEYAAEKGNKEALGTTLRLTDLNARTSIRAARVVLAQSLGEIWNAAWEPTGFPNQSTAVPLTQEVTDEPLREPPRILRRQSRGGERPARGHLGQSRRKV
jgi:hypothetical protein